MSFRKTETEQFLLWKTRIYFLVVNKMGVYDLEMKGIIIQDVNLVLLCFYAEIGTFRNILCITMSSLALQPHIDKAAVGLITSHYIDM